jgi:hypothetical protein
MRSPELAGGELVEPAERGEGWLKNLSDLRVLRGEKIPVFSLGSLVAKNLRI